MQVELSAWEQDDIHSKIVLKPLFQSSQSIYKPKIQIERPSVQRFNKEAPIKLQPRTSLYEKSLTENHLKSASKQRQRKTIFPPLFLQKLKKYQNNPYNLKHYKSTNIKTKDKAKISENINKSLIQKCSLKNMQLFQNVRQKKYTVQSLMIKKLLKSSNEKEHVLDRVLSRYQ